MDSLQKKIFAVLFTVFLALLGFGLPHKPLSPAPMPLKQVLSETAAADLSDFHTEPEDGNKFILDKINSATSSLHLSMYLLSDPEIVAALVAAKNRGVEVKVVLEKAPFGGSNVNKTSRAALVDAGIPVRDPPALVNLLHQKTLLVDRRELVISTFNYTRAAFSANRGFSLLDRSPTDVAAAEAIFEADFNHLLAAADSAALVISPAGSRAKLTSLIAAAQKKLDVADELISDPQIIALLINKAKTIPVRVLLADPKKITQNQTVAQDLKTGGVAVRFLLRPYLHVKYIVADETYGYLGSVNLTQQSLDQNREMGIIFSKSDFISLMSQQFTADWDMAVE